MVFEEVVGIESKLGFRRVVVQTHHPASEHVAFVVGNVSISHGIGASAHECMPEGLEIPAVLAYLVFATFVLVVGATKLRCHLQSQLGCEGLFFLSDSEIAGFGVHEHIFVIIPMSVSKVFLEMVIGV